MAKANTPKLLPFLNTAIQLCRPKHPSSMVKKGPMPGPLPAALNYFSPFGSFHLSFPNFPDPPSTPDTDGTKHDAGSSKIAAELACGGPSKESYKSHRIQRHNAGSSKIAPEQFCGGPSEQHELIDDFSPYEDYSRMRKSGSCGYVSSSSMDSSRVEKKEKTLTRKSISNHECDNFGPSKTKTKTVSRSCRRSTKPRRFNEQRLKGVRSKDYWDEDTKIAPKSQPKERKHISDKRVRNEESFVVVTRSEDPYEDFKKSMMEMIVEKQLFEPKELEQLLMSFLSLNSRLHHTVILQAFTQILKDLYSPGDFKV